MEALYQGSCSHRGELPAEPVLTDESRDNGRGRKMEDVALLVPGPSALSVRQFCKNTVNRMTRGAPGVHHLAFQRGTRKIGWHYGTCNA